MSSLTQTPPDSKYQEKVRVSSSLNGNTPSNSDLDSKKEPSKKTGDGNTCVNETITKNQANTNNHCSSTPPPLEPIPASLFPGESAKIYSGMPPLISSSSMAHLESPNNRSRDRERSSYDQVQAPSRSPPNRSMRTFHIQESTAVSTSPQLMPPPLNEVKRMKQNSQETSPIKNGQSNLRFPDSSNSSYSSRPGTSSEYYQKDHRATYPNHSYHHMNGNGKPYYNNHRYGGAIHNPSQSSTRGRVHLVNGNAPYTKLGSETRRVETDDNNEIINVDEDVDLERMYLDLITEEYTATVKG